MASLALLAALIILSFWLVAGLSLLAAFFGFRWVGLLLGLLSILMGVWLLFVLPHIPFLGLINIVAGVVAVSKWRKK